jgi:hypothetical protein
VCRMLLREIATERNCVRTVAADFFGDSDGLLLVDIDDCDSGAFASQFTRRRRTNPARTSGNYGDLSGKSGHRVLPLLFSDAQKR